MGNFIHPKPVVDHNVHEKSLTSKQYQASNYNMGTKDLGELKNWKYNAFDSPTKLTNKAVKTRVGKPMGTRS